MVTVDDTRRVTPVRRPASLFGQALKGHARARQAFELETIPPREWRARLPTLQRVHDTQEPLAHESAHQHEPSLLVEPAGEVEWTGTNSGPMEMGGKEIPPTNKTVIGRGSYIAFVRGGKVVEFRSHPDTAGIMMQLGLLPPM